MRFEVLDEMQAHYLVFIRPHGAFTSVSFDPNVFLDADCSRKFLNSGAHHSFLVCTVWFKMLKKNNPLVDPSLSKCATVTACLKTAQDVL